MLNARAESGQNYRVLSNVSTLSGAPLGPGGTFAGKLYFDVVGDVPNSVVYNDGVQDLLVWVATATPAMPDGASSGGSSDTSINGGPTGGSANTGSAELGPFGGAGTGDNASGGLDSGITGSGGGGGGLGGAPGAGGNGAGAGGNG